MATVFQNATTDRVIRVGEAFVMLRRVEDRQRLMVDAPDHVLVCTSPLWADRVPPGSKLRPWPSYDVRVVRLSMELDVSPAAMAARLDDLVARAANGDADANEELARLRVIAKRVADESPPRGRRAWRC